MSGAKLTRPAADTEASTEPDSEGQQQSDESQAGPDPLLRTREGRAGSPIQGLQLTAAQSQQLAQVLPRSGRPLPNAKSACHGTIEGSVYYNVCYTCPNFWTFAILSAVRTANSNWGKYSKHCNTYMQAMS